MTKPKPNLLDGQWHRLHPITPILRGGFAVITIFSIVFFQFGEALFNELLGSISNIYRFWDLPNAGTILLVIILAVLVLAVLLGTVFWLSWRMHMFRVTEESLEVKSGILFKVNRKVRLDRIQSIDIHRPLFARIFGAARLVIDGAGNSAKVQLAFLGSSDADIVRHGLLRISSGAKQQVAPGQPYPQLTYPGQPYPPGQPYEANQSLAERRIAEFSADELDVYVTPQSVVRIPVGRIIASTVLNGFTFFLVAMIIAVLIVVAVTNNLYILAGFGFGFLPVGLAVFAFYFSKITKMVRYSIAKTPHGIRIGYGLFSLTNKTIPPRRIHSVEAIQPLFWRIVGWWKISINLASQNIEDTETQADDGIVLPVGTRQDVLKVLELLMPGLDVPNNFKIIDTGLLGQGQAQGYKIAPPRARIFLPMAWRRQGWRLDEHAVHLRHGKLTRRLSLLPFERIQSITIGQGWIAKKMRLAQVRFDQVSGMVNNTIDNLDAEDALTLFSTASQLHVSTSARERSERWADESNLG